MADELDDADDQVRAHAGFENHPYGTILVRIMRHLRLLTSAVRDLKTRMDRIDPPQR